MGFRSGEFRAAGSAVSVGQVSGGGREFSSGLYYPTMPSGQDTTVAVNQSTMYSARFAVGYPTSFDRVGIEVTTAAALAVGRLGLYSSYQGKPNTLLVDWSSAGGTLDFSSTGFKEYTINDMLQAGIYYVAVVVQAAGGVSVRGRNGGDPFIGQSVSTTQTNGGFASTGTVTGALPTPFPYAAVVAGVKPLLRAV